MLICHFLLSHIIAVPHDNYNENQPGIYISPSSKKEQPIRIALFLFVMRFFCRRTDWCKTGVFV